MHDSAPATMSSTTPNFTGAIGRPPRNSVAALLTPNDIRVDLDVPTKQRALEFIARFVGVRDGLIDDEVYASLTERERLGSTAIGRGVAIPHARAKGLDHPVAAYVRLKNPIPFDAPDGRPVSDIFVLIVPLYAADKHLQLLAQVAEMFCDKAFRDKLRACAHPQDVYAAFSAWEHA